MGGSRLPDDLLEKLLAATDRDLNNIGDLELALEELKVRAAQQLADKHLQSLPPEDGKPRSCPHCGKSVPNVGDTEEAPTAARRIELRHFYPPTATLLSPAVLTAILGTRPAKLCSAKLTCVQSTASLVPCV